MILTRLIDTGIRAEYNGFMPTHIAIGFSSASDPVEAFKAAAIEVKTKLNAVQTNLVLVFATASYASPEGLATLRRILQPKHLTGAVTPGVILEQRVEMHGVGIMGIISDDLLFSTALLNPIGATPPRDVGHRFAKSLMDNHKSAQRSSCVFFYDGLRRHAAPRGNSPGPGGARQGWPAQPRKGAADCPFRR